MKGKFWEEIVMSQGREAKIPGMEGEGTILLQCLSWRLPYHKGAEVYIAHMISYQLIMYVLKSNYIGVT